MNIYEVSVIIALLVVSGVSGILVGRVIESTKTTPVTEDHPEIIKTFHNVIVDFSVGHVVNYNLDIDGEQQAFGRAHATSVIEALVNFHEANYGDISNDCFRELDIWNEPSLPIHIEIGDVSYRVDFYVQTYGNKVYEWENVISG